MRETLTITNCNYTDNKNIYYFWFLFNHPIFLQLLQVRLCPPKRGLY